MCTSNAPLSKGAGLFIKCALSSATIEEPGSGPDHIPRSRSEDRFRGYLSSGLKDFPFGEGISYRTPNKGGSISI